MIYLKQLKDLRLAEELRVQNLIEDTHPVVTNVIIYSYNNISISSENFSIDMYQRSTYTKDDIKMNCTLSSTAIPTEQQAIEQVRALHAERADFILAIQYVQTLLTPPIEL